MSKQSAKEKALLRAKKDNDIVEIIVCPISDEELYFTNSSGAKYIFESFGICTICKESFHVSAMKRNEGAVPSPWAIHYEGLYCKKCYYSDNHRALPEVKSLSSVDKSR